MSLVEMLKYTIILKLLTPYNKIKRTEKSFMDYCFFFKYIYKSVCKYTYFTRDKSR